MGVVGVVKEQIHDFLEVSEDVGCAPDIERKITEDDYLMFVSDMSMPTFRPEEQQTEDRRFQPRQASKGNPMEHRETSFILICGWRPEWNITETFARRLDSFTR